MKFEKKYDTSPSKEVLKKYDSFFKKKGVKKPNVVIHGGYGKDNVGDEAILEVMVNRIRKYMPNAKITVFSYNPKKTSKLFNVESCYFITLKALKSVINSDLVLIGGGGIVNKINTYSGFEYLKIFDPKGKVILLNAIFSKIIGKKVIFYVVGTTSIPDYGSKILLKWSAKMVDYVFVRDPLSYKILKNLGVKRKIITMYDPVIDLDPAPKNLGNSILKKQGFKKGKVIGLSMRYIRDKKINENTLIESIKLVNFLIEKGYNILCVPMSKHPSKPLENDINLAKDIQKNVFDKSKYKILTGDYRPKEIKSLFGELDFCILSRLHACIMTEPMGTPYICISYDNKVTQFVKMVGKQDFLFNLNGVQYENIKSKLKKLLKIK